MDFIPEKVNDFLDIFASSRDKIAAFNGCKSVDLLNSVEDKSVFFTYSFWESEAHLEAYRNSELFKQTWAKTKILFRNKAEAWSVINTGI